MVKGKIITLSGIDGSGKSTCANWIKNHFNSIGHDAVIIDAMKFGIFTEGLKRYASLQQEKFRRCFSADMINLSWAADLIHNHETSIKKALNEGTTVILHRSELCCKVYSRVFSPYNDVIDHILDSYDFQYDASIFLDINPALAYQRITARSNKKQCTEKETLAMLTAADAQYHKYLKKPQYNDFYVVDMSFTEQQVYTKIVNILTQIGV